MKPKRKKKPTKGATERSAADTKSKKRRLSTASVSAPPSQRVKTCAHPGGTEVARAKTIARPVTRASAARARDVFPFMELAGELRNRIYEMVIEDIATTPDKPIDVFRCHLDPINWGLVSDVSRARDSGFWRYGVSDGEFNEQLQLRESRKSLAACRLGEVSRAIRNEFVPLLWSCMHFRYCPCGLELGEENALGFLDQPLVRGSLKHIVYDMHYTRLYEGKFNIGKLVNFLFALEFEGDVKVIGERCLVHLVGKALKLIGTSYDNSAAAQKAKRQFKQIENLIDRSRPWARPWTRKDCGTFEIDFQKTTWRR